MPLITIPHIIGSVIKGVLVGIKRTRTKTVSIITTSPR